jgi:hypothetical protein
MRYMYAIYVKPFHVSHSYSFTYTYVHLVFDKRTCQKNSFMQSLPFYFKIWWKLCVNLFGEMWNKRNEEIFIFSFFLFLIMNLTMIYCLWNWKASRALLSHCFIFLHRVATFSPHSPTNTHTHSIKIFARLKMLMKQKRGKL